MNEPKNGTQFDTLEAFMAQLGETWTFDKTRYPRMPDPETDGHAAGAFAFAHILTHMMKSAGELAAHLERFDHHGNTYWIHCPETCELVRKQFVNALRMATLLGVTPEQLLFVPAPEPPML